MAYLKISRRAYLILTFSVIFFIFFNSSQSADASGSRSKTLLHSVLNVIDRVEPQEQTVSIKMPVLEDTMGGKQDKPEQSLPQPGEKPDTGAKPAETGGEKPDTGAKPAETDGEEPDTQVDSQPANTSRVYFGWFTRSEFISIFHKRARKAAHFLEYSVLAMVISLFLSTYYKSVVRLIPSCVLLGLLCACLDEMIQRWTPGRSASVYDVLLDGFGVAFGVILISRRIARRSSRLEKEGLIPPAAFLW